MLPFSRKARWSLDSLTPPWGEMVSIYDHIRAAPDRQSLPDEPLLRKKYKFGWVGGALDGVFGRHTARGESTKKVFESVEALRRLLQEANKETLTNLYDLIVREVTADHIADDRLVVDDQHGCHLHSLSTPLVSRRLRIP